MAAELCRDGHRDIIDYDKDKQLDTGLQAGNQEHRKAENRKNCV